MRAETSHAASAKRPGSSRHRSANPHVTACNLRAANRFVKRVAGNFTLRPTSGSNAPSPAFAPGCARSHRASVHIFCGGTRVLGGDAPPSGWNRVIGPISGESEPETVRGGRNRRFRTRRGRPRRAAEICASPPVHDRGQVRRLAPVFSEIPNCRPFVAPARPGGGLLPTRPRIFRSAPKSGRSAKDGFWCRHGQQWDRAVASQGRWPAQVLGRRSRAPHANP